MDGPARRVLASLAYAPEFVYSKQQCTLKNVSVGGVQGNAATGINAATAKTTSGATAAAAARGKTGGGYSATTGIRAAATTAAAAARGKTVGGSSGTKALRGRVGGNKARRLLRTRTRPTSNILHLRRASV